MGHQPLAFRWSLAGLVFCSALVILAWQHPYGRLALLPLTLLATFVHELGHGLAALLLGCEVERILLYSDGSGLAQWRGTLGPLARAVVAAAGLIGPTVAGAVLLFAARSPRRVRIALASVGVLLLVVALIWVRNLFGIFFLLILGSAILFAVRKCSTFAQLTLLQLIALTLCFSLFSDVDYMFSAYAEVDGLRIPSDTAHIAEALMLPYWVWGTLLSVLAATISLVSLRSAVIHSFASATSTDARD